MSGFAIGDARRRLFFRYMARETLVWCEEMCGVRHIRLSDIPKFPPQAFAALIPRVCPGVEIVPQAGRVCARLPGAKDTVTLFPASDDACLAVFNRFNGRNTLGQAASSLAGAMGWSAAESMSRVRALFLRLLALRVCVPCNDVSAEIEAARRSGA